jgi:hypothetical protein
MMCSRCVHNVFAMCSRCSQSVRDVRRCSRKVGGGHERSEVVVDLVRWSPDIACKPGENDRRVAIHKALSSGDHCRDLDCTFTFTWLLTTS